jgi:hypothetical protein
MKFLSSVSVIAFAHLSLAAAVLAQSPSPYIISGQVIDEFGRSAPDVRVCAIPVVDDRPERGVFCGTSSDDGKFVIREREAGRFKLIYEKMSDGYVPQRWSFYRHQSIVIPEVTVNDESRSASASVMLGPKGGVLTGKAVDGSTNLPLEDIQVTLCRSAEPKNCFRDTVKSPTGRFRMVTSPDSFTVKITADGFEDWVGPSGPATKASPFFVASGESLDLLVVMNRQKVTEGKAISDAEKSVWGHLPAPVQLAPAEFARLNEYPRATKLEWSSVEGAVSYKLEVDYCQGREDECISPHPLPLKASSPLTETSFQFNFIGAQPGRWRVWAVDKDGREGFKSPWRLFIYLR